MARLLLGSARMRGVWALLPLLASSGCLFLDVPNHPPSVQMSVDAPTTIKGSPLMFHASADDLEDHANLAITFAVSAVDGLPFDPACDVEEHPAGDYDSVTFYRTGTFMVDATATDSGGAMTHDRVMVTITDAAPAFTGNGMAAQSSSGNACGSNTAGQFVTVHLDGGVSDADLGTHASGCFPTEKLTYTWRLVDWPAAGTLPVLTPFDGTRCADPTSSSSRTLVVDDASAHVCVKTVDALSSGVGMYKVQLDVTDGNGSDRPVIHSAPADITVGPDQPPCITGTEPVAGSYVVDRTQPQSFYVDGAVDDLDGFDAGISYVWSVYRYADDSWRDVPSWSLSTYTLDLSSFGVGEKLRVRVEALDRTGRRDTTCAKASDDCTPSSCITTVCHKWKTWDLELR